MKCSIYQKDDNIVITDVQKINIFDEHYLLITIDESTKISITGNNFILNDFNSKNNTVDLSGAITSYYLIDKYQDQKPKKIRLSNKLKNILKQAKEEVK